LAAAAGLVLAQQSPAPLAFEVASVKLHPLPPGSFIIRMGPARGSAPPAPSDRVEIDVITLNELIMEAYDVKDYQVIGSPDWAIPPVGDRYDIVAKTDGIATASQVREMLRTLLAERFQLKLYRETKELPVYALVVSKAGKLREVSEAELAARDEARRKEQPNGGRPTAGTTATSNMFMLAKLIQGVVDRPVIDQTGLAGIYEYPRLDWRQFGMNKRAGDVDGANGESIFGALQQQLGLKLEPRKERAEVLVIDHAQKPSAN
jgi:uncharacterized protein (TIGR03435 family)